MLETFSEIFKRVPEQAHPDPGWEMPRSTGRGDVFQKSGDLKLIHTFFPPKSIHTLAGSEIRLTS